MGRLERFVVGVAAFVMLFAVVGGGLVPGIANTAQAQGWSFVGPEPVEPSHTSAPGHPNFDRNWGNSSGRITSVAVVPDNHAEIYVGAAGGGVWKSVDSGKTWEPLTDNVLPHDPTGSSMAIGALAVNSTGQTVYAGTGEINPGGSSQYGQGLLKSTDGGKTWTVYANSRSVFRQHYIGGVAFSGNTVLVATDQGVYKSTSVFLPWRKLEDLNSKIPALREGEEVSGQVFELHRDPVTPTELTATLTDGETTVTGMSVALPVGAAYAVTGAGIPAHTTLTVTGSGTTATLSNAATSTGESTLTVGGRKYWATFGDGCRTEAGGIATSDDGGETWKVVYSNRNAGRIALGVGSDGKVAYAGVANCSGALLSIQKTTDGEKATPTWTPIPTDTPGYTDYFKGRPDDQNAQGDYDNVVGVDPADSKRAVFAGITILATSDGGKKLTNVGHVYNKGFIHPDFHAIAFSGASSFYAGEDGGLYHTSNMGGTGTEAKDWTNLNGAPATPGKQGLRITQFNAGVSPSATDLLGGTQDNGTPAALPGVAPKLPAMGDITSGDGGDTAIDTTHNTVYTEYPRLAILRTTGLGGERVETNIPPCPRSRCNDPRGFYAPFVMDHTKPERLLAGTNRVYETTNARTGNPVTWTATPSEGKLTKTDRGWLSSIALAPTGGNTIFTASNDGEVARTTDGKDWTDITGNLPTRGQATNPFGPDFVPKPFFTQVTFNRANSSQAWVTISYLGQGHLWYTRNAGTPADEGGTTWIDLSGTGDTALPSAPALSVVEAPGTSDIYVGTYYGVWRCGTCGGPSPEGSWHRFGGIDLATGALPKVEVDRLSVTNKLLVAWTHGRGIWKISLPPATTMSTSLSGAGQTGAKITVPAGTEVTDQATLAGEKHSTATGSVTYTWYSDAACTNVVSGPDKHTITTAGTIPASQPVTLNNPGTYHAVASYTGDPHNGASRSHCGDETATVP